MVLNITAEYNKSFVENVCSLATHMLSIPSTHLFIASNTWEEIDVDVNDEIPEGCLHCLSLACDNIKVRLPENVTDKTVRLLAEALPDKAGVIRRAYMQGTPIKEVLKDCVVR